MGSPGSVYLLYHFFHPDDVVSGRLFADLAEDLTDAGFDVTALPSIRSCHGSKVRLKQCQSWEGVKIRRVWRPDWPQHKTWGRFGNTLCMLLGWTWRAALMRRRRGEVMIVGTDPVLAVLIAITWRLFRPSAKIIHWCHDVYPHAAIADGLIRGDAPWVRLIHFMLRVAYRRCDVIADLGICMRRLLQQASGDPVGPLSEADHSLADHSLSDASSADDRSIWNPRTATAELTATLGQAADEASPVLQATARDVATSDSPWRAGRFATLVPWSLVEPVELPESDPFIRSEFFGDARLGLLYSGNFGRGHCFESILALARRLRGDDIAFCFAGRGLRLESVRQSVTWKDTNIRFAGFAEENQLEARLAAADVHLVSLRPSWTGAVVPSKFFGALASGRPVLFAGSPDSAIAQWIEEFEIGWVLTERTVDRVADELKQISDDPLGQEELRQRCFEVYHHQFSRRMQVDKWLQILTGQPSVLTGQPPAKSNDRFLCSDCVDAREPPDPAGDRGVESESRLTER